MQALVIRISRDVYVTVNFMLNKRKSKKAAGASPQTHLLLRQGARPLPYPPPVVNIFITPPLSQNPGSAPAVTWNCFTASTHREKFRTLNSWPILQTSVTFPAHASMEMYGVKFIFEYRESCSLSLKEAP